MSDYENDTMSDVEDTVVDGNITHGDDHDDGYGHDDDADARGDQENRHISTVKWFNNAKGFGFIVPPEGETDDIFVHYRSIVGDGFKTLTEGARVSFVIARSDKGLQASDVMLLAD